MKLIGSISHTGIDETGLAELSSQGLRPKIRDGYIDVDLPIAKNPETGIDWHVAPKTIGKVTFMLMASEEGGPNTHEATVVCNLHGHPYQIRQYSAPIEESDKPFFAGTSNMVIVKATEERIKIVRYDVSQVRRKAHIVESSPAFEGRFVDLPVDLKRFSQAALKAIERLLCSDPCKIHFCR